MKQNVNAIVLYGSFARGDYSQESDIDICIFIADDSDENILNPFVSDYIKAYEIQKQNISIYRESVLKEMIQYGSLFLWHIKLEGKYLLGKEYMHSMLSNLPDFKHHKEELQYHRQLLDSLIKAQEDIGTVSDFDLSLLFTITRNICMVLAHKNSIFVFAKYECYKKVAQLYPNIPMSEKEYLVLASCKNAYERCFDRVENDISVDSYIQKVDNFLKFSMQYV